MRVFHQNCHKATNRALCTVFLIFRIFVRTILETFHWNYVLYIFGDQNGINQNGQNGQNEANDYYKLTVNGSEWKIHKSKAVIKANTDDNLMDYTVSIIAIDASNSINADSKQLNINFNASDLESVKSENLALSEGFNILYRAKDNFSTSKYTYQDGIMSITELEDDYVKINFSNLSMEKQNSIIIENQTLNIYGTIKCKLK